MYIMFMYVCFSMHMHSYPRYHYWLAALFFQALIFFSTAVLTCLCSPGYNPTKNKHSNHTKKGAKVRLWWKLSVSAGFLFSK